MNGPTILDLWREALSVAAYVAAPFLLAALAIGLVTSLIQAATQIQENILSFVPKLIAVGLVMTLSGHLLLDRLTRFTVSSWNATLSIGKQDYPARDSQPGGGAL